MTAWLQVSNAFLRSQKMNVFAFEAEVTVHVQYLKVATSDGLWSDGV
jgi:hypothetical protein